MRAKTRAFQTDMPQHGRLCMFLPCLLGRTRIKLRQKLPLLPVMLKKGRHLQYLRHHISNLIKETHLQKKPAMGTATRIVAKERMTQTPPLLSRLIQGYLDHTGIWAFGVESRQAAVVLPCLQSCLEDLRALTGGYSDKASELLTPTIRAYLSQQGVRQTVTSGYDPQGNGLAERWIGIVKVRATALLADVRLPPDYWSYACRWVAYVHTHRVTEIPLNKALPHFGDVVVLHHAFKKPPSFENRGTTGVCLGHDSRIAGGVLVVSVVNSELKEVCSAKVRTLGEKVGQAWRLHVHPQDSSKAAYVNRKGEVKWSLHEIEVPSVEQCVKEDALEVQDIRELGLGWAWFMNDLRAFLPAWQEMELASPYSEEPVTQIEAEVPIEPLAL